MNMVGIGNATLFEISSRLCFSEAIERERVEHAVVAIGEPALGIEWQRAFDGQATGDYEHHAIADIGGEKMVEEPGSCLFGELFKGIEEKQHAATTASPLVAECDLCIGNMIQLG